MRASFFRNITLLIIVISLISPCHAQYTLQIKENKHAGALTRRQPKQGNALIIFNTYLELNFESSWGIEDTIKEKNCYILEVEAVDHAISLYYENIPITLNFGNILGATANKFSKLNPGDIKCFDIDIKPVLLATDITDNQLKTGNSIVPIGPNVSDALFLVYIFPSELELTISETNNLISKLEKKGSSYTIMLKMPDNKKFVSYDLRVKSDETDEISITLPKMSPKDFKIYNIKLPLTPETEPKNTIRQIKEKEMEAVTIPTASSIDYRKNVIGNWAGSLGDDKTYLEFTTFDEGKKTLAGKIFANGVYRNFKGVVRFRTENDYQATLNIVKDDLIPYGASLQLRFNSGALNGLWIDDMGVVSDFSALRSSSIIYDNSKEVQQRIAILNNSASGTWNAVNSNLYFDNVVIDKYNINQITSISFVKSNQPAVNVKGKLISKSGQLTLMVSDVQFHGISSLCTVTLLFSGQDASLSLISDDGSIIQTHKLRRSSGKSTVSAVMQPEAKVKTQWLNDTVRYHYNQMKYNVTKILPYLDASTQLFNHVNALVNDEEVSKKERRKYLNSLEDELRTKLEDKIKQLNVTQGTLLLKLICRQTGLNLYKILKEFKNPLTAVKWQAWAKLNGLNLDKRYNPKEERDLENIMEELGYPLPGGY